MGKDTGIQWCDSTVSPTTGCDGCELFVPGKGGPCYAGALHEGRLAKSLPALYAPAFTEVRLAPGRMKQAAGWGDLRGVERPGKPWIPPATPRLIFVEDMGDLFSKAVPFEYVRDEVFGTATSPKGARHVYQILTKQPRRMAEFARWLAADCGCDWPENVWAGTSVTSRKTLKRVDYLTEVPAAVRFLSLEPLWERVDLLELHGDGVPTFPDVQWVIAGGESHQGEHRARRFDLAWARSLRDQCKEANVPYFLKQLGSDPTDGPLYPGESKLRAVSLRDSHGGDWGEWPEDLKVREFPAAPGPARPGRMF